MLSKLWTTYRLRVVPILKYACIRAVTTHALATRSTWLLKQSCLQIFEQKRDCSQSVLCKELIITCNRARVRKSFYRLILRLRHHFLIVHSRSTLVNVYSLLYEDIYSVQIWKTVFRRVQYKYQIHQQRVPVRIGSVTPPAGQVRFKSPYRLSTNCTIVVIRQVKIMIKNNKLWLLK